MFFLNRRIKKFFCALLSLLIFLLLSPYKIYAACNFQLKKPVNTLFGTFDCLDRFINAVLNWGTELISAACTLLIVFAGFRYITAAGNPEQIQKAKNLIIIAISSLILIILGRIIIKTINPAL